MTENPQYSEDQVGALKTTLEERITQLHHTLSTKQKTLARFVLDRKYFMSFASASLAGEKTGTSAATVVRFAQALGYQGYSEMQAGIRAELPSYLTAIERIQVSLVEPPSQDNIPQLVFYTDIGNIERTANNLSESKIDEVITRLIAADRILVIGSGLSAAPALFLAHSLKIMGYDARVNIGDGIFLAADTAQLQPGDVLIAIDMWRYIRSTNDAATYVKKHGVCTIAITDSIVSPLAKSADYALEAATEGVAHSLSTTGVMSLLNVIIALLSYRVPEQTVQTLRRVDASYKANRLLITE